MDVCFYSIIQCVPDPLAEERVNIGVLVVNGDNIEYKFLSNWKRAESFVRPGSMEITKSFRDELEYICLNAQRRGQLKLSATSEGPGETIKKMVSDWSNQIQFSELRPSLENPTDLLERLAGQFLVERVSVKRSARNRNQIMYGTQRQLRDAIGLQDPYKRGHLDAKLHTTAPGSIVDQLQVDVGLLNGQLRTAAESVSFQTLDVKEINFQWRESIYTLVDLRNEQPWVGAALVVAPPDMSSRRTKPWVSEYDAARKSAESNDIAIINEDDGLEDWADEQVRLALNAS